LKKLLALAALLFFAIFVSKAVVKRKSKSLRIQSANERIEADRHSEIGRADDSLKAYFKIGKTVPAEYPFDPAQYEIKFQSEKVYSDSIRLFLEQAGLSAYPPPKLSALMHDVYVNQRFTDMHQRYLFEKLHVYYRNYQALHYYGSPEAFSVWVLYDDVVVVKRYRQDSCAIKAWKFFAR
jgi:hypothetical protein